MFKPLKYDYLLRMRVGDVIVRPAKYFMDVQKFHGAATAYGKRSGMRFSVRKDADRGIVTITRVE